eukprot:TRINITY_DN14264_c0_g1_i2.p1 TRINITY_DN14264_c0_g1~~TRINITY_DN14264_c0_g1_i2.p1  ORF type:complete len:464 (+),score=69.01 TRINITY_DN14264_c0_g1_i2:60-1451(+)
MCIRDRYMGKVLKMCLSMMDGEILNKKSCSMNDIGGRLRQNSLLHLPNSSSTNKSLSKSKIPCKGIDTGLEKRRFAYGDTEQKPFLSSIPLEKVRLPSLNSTQTKQNEKGQEPPAHSEVHDLPNTSQGINLTKLLPKRLSLPLRQRTFFQKLPSAGWIEPQESSSNPSKTPVVERSQMDEEENTKMKEKTEREKVEEPLVELDSNTLSSISNGRSPKSWVESQLVPFEIADSMLEPYYEAQRAALARVEASKGSSGPISNRRPVLARVGNNRVIVQPEFMLKKGSMCVTEFWTEKQRLTYATKLGGELPVFTFDYKTKGILNDETLFHPSDVKTRRMVMDRRAVAPDARFEYTKLLAPSQMQSKRHPSVSSVIKDDRTLLQSISARFSPSDYAPEFVRSGVRKSSMHSLNNSRAYSFEIATSRLQGTEEVKESKTTVSQKDFHRSQTFGFLGSKRQSNASNLS